MFERFYGGDLQGVQEKLGYLQRDLGVTGIVLTPIFSAQSFHGYDITDYRHIEDRLAVEGASRETRAREEMLNADTWTWSDSDRVFLDFINLCHSRGLKVLIDIPFNHSSNEHPAFLSVRNEGRALRFPQLVRSHLVGPARIRGLGRLWQNARL